MTHMIGHHAQAIEMARFAPTHGASSSIQVLAERIINAQQDEIATMERWLRDRSLPLPGPADAAHDHGGQGAHRMLMPGMLTPEQMGQLDAARGAEFDRLFLTFMIQHHQGALQMVNTLFGSAGAANDDFVYKLASEIHAEQETEIERMNQMLASLPSGENRP
jgi:uncharacterized protein (DUF305 family)